MNVAAGAASSNPHGFTTFGSSLYFVAEETAQDFTLWRCTSSLSCGKVSMLNDMPMSKLQDLTVAFGSLYMLVEDPTDNDEKRIVKCSSTEVCSVLPAVEWGMAPGTLMLLVGQKLFFSGSDTTNGDELWSCDSSDACSVVQDFVSGPTTGANPAHLAEFQSQLVFRGSTGSTLGIELLKVESDFSS